MKSLSLKLSEALNAKLTAIARRRGTTKSAVVRDALEAFFAANGGVRKGCFRDLAADLIGCVQGPGDLSTNPKYMEDFGR